MVESNAEDISARGSDINKIIHDLRGPLINIEGLTAEVVATTEAILALLQASTDSDRDEHRQIAQLVETDLYPCLQFLTQSAAQLHDRVDSLASARG